MTQWEIYEHAKLFKIDSTNVANERQPGPPRTSAINNIITDVEAMIYKNRQGRITDITASLNSSY
jgi:hypothetical protein